MTKIGYMRVSTDKQDHALQFSALKQAGVLDENIYQDVISGSKFKRDGLDDAMKRLKDGGTLVVWKLDRLGRSGWQVMKLVEELIEAGVGVVSLTEGFDATTPMGKAMLGIMAVMAELERNNIRERTKAGVSAARARGARLGRPAVHEDKYAQVRSMLAGGATVRAVAKATGVSKSQVAKIGKGA